jgi:ATP-binding cassette, subfamily B, bacterial
MRLRGLSGLIAPLRAQLTWLLVLSVLGTSLGLSGPFVLRHAIDQGVRGHDARLIVRDALAFLAITLGAFVLSRAHALLSGKLGEHVVCELRRAVFRHVLRMSTRYVERATSGSLIARMTADIDTLQDLLQLGVTQFVQSALTLALLCGVLSLLSWRLFAVCALPLLALTYAAGWFQRRSREAYRSVRERLGATLGTLVESVAGIRVVQAFVQEEARRERFVRESERLCEAGVAAARVQAGFLPVIELSTMVSTVLTLGVGAWLVRQGVETVGTISAFCLYLLMAFEPVQILSILFTTFQSAAASLERLLAMLDEAPDLAEGDLPLPARATLSLRDVEHRYDPAGKPALHGVSLSLPHGTRLAIVGPSGAGKSTLAKLMARLEDPIKGSVSYGGVELRQARHDALRARIVMVSQEGHIFAGTVADNLRAVRTEATDAEMRDALARIGALEHVLGMPDGLASQVGARGALLSSGERQLLALARVAMRDADVLIFDEATSALDKGTELLVNRALHQLMADRTVIIVAHRLATLAEVDQVVFVAAGAIVERGSPRELLARGERFAELYRDWEAGGAAPSAPSLGGKAGVS